MSEIRRVLNFSEIEEIYRGPMQRDFPDNERKPLQEIREMWDRGEYICYGLYDGAARLGYAFLVRLEREYGADVLLDYLAVDAAKRSEGLGSDFLKQLWPTLEGTDCVMIESEDPDCAEDAETKALRQRRIRFYLRSGCLFSTLRSRILGADYVVLEYPLTKAHDGGELAERYETLYRRIMPKRFPQYKDKLQIE